MRTEDKFRKLVTDEDSVINGDSIITGRYKYLGCVVTKDVTTKEELKVVQDKYEEYTTPPSIIDQADYKEDKS